MSTNTAIFKSANEDERLVFAEVYAPMRPDTDGEYMDAEGIRKMAYQFMQDMGLDQVDSQHDNNLVDGCVVVESFIARKGDPTFIEGSWVVGMHVNNAEMWDKIKKGEINGFSIEAMVHKDTKNVEIDMPNTLAGSTLPSSTDKHVHSFSVAYDPAGNFIGGTTDTVDGHFHIIKRGTITETSNGHNHRFSHVDSVVIKEV
jgi:hypothetical protein